MSCKASFLSLLSVTFLLGCSGAMVQPSNGVSSISSTDGGGLGSTNGGGTSTPQTLNIVVKNLNTKYTDANVFFTFRSAPVTGTINGQPLNLNQSYSIADIGSGLVLQSFLGGRIYFSLGTALVGTDAPEPVNPSVENWGTRFDKMEMFYQPGAVSVADMTSFDFFAIPMTIKTYQGSTLSKTLACKSPGNTVIAGLGALTKNDASVVLKTPQGQFVRVLGPNLAPAGKYLSFAPYIAATRSSGVNLHITGLFSRAGTTIPTMTQNYDFTSSFDASGNMHLSGGGTPYNGGSSVGPGHQIVIAANDLLNGIYSANPPYTVDGNAAKISDNDVYAATVRDVLAGFSLGFVNSTVTDPNTGTPFRNEASNLWWASPQAFGFLQPNNVYYDPYASYLKTVSDAYGSPFSDRWESVQAPLNSPITTLEIDVLPD